MELNNIRQKIEKYEDDIIKLINDRIQLGIDVANIKYDSIKYQINDEHTNILDLITNEEVENKIYSRLKNKTNPKLSKYLIELYKHYIIPETKNVQINTIKKIKN